MTILAAYTDGKKTWVGGDTQATAGNLVFKDVSKWTIHENWAIGQSGSVRAINIIEANIEALVKGLYEPFDFTSRLRDIFDEEGIIPGELERGTEGGPEEFGEYVLLAKPGNVWAIGSDLSIYPVATGKVIAEGCGYQYAYGAAFDTADLKPQERIKRMIAAAIEYDPYCGGEIQIHCLK